MSLFSACRSASGQEADFLSLHLCSDPSSPGHCRSSRAKQTAQKRSRSSPHSYWGGCLGTPGGWGAFGWGLQDAHPGPTAGREGADGGGEAAPSHSVSPHLSSHAPTSPLPCHLLGDTLQPDLVPPWRMLEGQSTCNVTRCLCTSCSMSPPPTSHPITLCALQEQGPLVPASPLLCPL